MTAISSAPAAPEGRLRLTRDSLLPTSGTSGIPNTMDSRRGWFHRPRPRRRDPGPVDELSVSHLQRLGFQKATARNALVYARNDVALAIELAIHDTHPLNNNPDCPICQGRAENNAMRQWFKDQDLRPSLRDKRLTVLSAALDSSQSFARDDDERLPSSSPYAKSTGRGSYSYHANYSYANITHHLHNLSAESVSAIANPGAEPDQGEEDGETSVPMPTTPRSSQSMTPPLRHSPDDARSSPTPTPLSVSVPLNGDTPSRRYFSSTGPIGVSPINTHPRGISPSLSSSGISPISMSDTKRSRSRDNISYRTHSRVQSVSSFYGWYQSQNANSSGHSGSSGGSDVQSMHSPARPRADSIGRAF